ncbi:hypothetical protein [Alloscardovia omnicolens]|uniref:hypothetical protein n=1 Tax=Alloscardovia omnicolens TaxID=419015 RepID=UPI003A65EE4A
MRQMRLLKTLLVASLVCSLVGGCSYIVGVIRGSNRGDGYSREFNIDGSKLDGLRVDLSDVIAIVPLYELADSTTYPKDRSQIAFIYKDGTYKIQDNSYMFGKHVVWTSKGVFYSDRKYDYFIDAHSNKIKVTKHQKTEFEYTTYALDESHSLTMYNKGIGTKDNGVLSVSSSDGEYNEFTYTQQNEGILGENVAVCENGNSYHVAPDNERFDRPINVMYQLTEKNTPTYKKVHDIKTVNAQDFSNAQEVLEYTENKPAIRVRGYGKPLTVCKNNWIYSAVEIGKDLTSYDSNEKGFLLGILKWNVISGEYAITVLRDQHGQLLYSPYGSQWNGTMYTSGSLNENSFIIASYDSGSIFNADLTTGKMTEIVPPLVSEDKWPIGRVFLDCTDEYIYQTWLPINDGLGKHSYINVYSRKTNKLVSSLKIDDNFTKHIQIDTVQPGVVALNPKLFREN